VEKSVENFEPVEKKDKRISFPQFPQAVFSTACGKVENFV
jgi:hypothetical protein